MVDAKIEDIELDSKEFYIYAIQRILLGTLDDIQEQDRELQVRRMAGAIAAIKVEFFVARYRGIVSKEDVDLSCEELLSRVRECMEFFRVKGMYEEVKDENFWKHLIGEK